MQSVLVSPFAITDAHESILPYLEDSDKFTLSTPAATNEELTAMGGEATVVATGSEESVRAFAAMVAHNGRFPEIDDPRLFDMRGLTHRLADILQGGTRFEDGTCRLEVKVTLP